MTNPPGAPEKSGAHIRKLTWWLAGCQSKTITFDHIAAHNEML
jgi:hypothetical protein